MDGTGDGPGSPGFGTELRRLRRLRGLSLADLARQVNYSKGYLSRIESGVRAANPALARACDAALGAEGRLAAHLKAVPAARRITTLRPAQLPAATGGFAGRDGELSSLDTARADASTLILVTGTAGVGKTALAVRWAHRISRGYPDGVLYLDLHGAGDLPAADPTEVLARFLRGLGTPAQDTPPTRDERAALYRSVLDGRRLLVVLDNAGSADQVRPLLPGTPSCLTVVTSRHSLSGLVARDGAVRIALAPMARANSVAVLVNALGADRVGPEPDHAGRIATLCAGLPLALRIAAERAAQRPGLSLSDLADQLSNEGRRLALLATDDGDTAVRAAFATSYDVLPAPAARLFRLLALHPGADLDADAIGALVGEPDIGALTRAHLLTEDRPGRYRRHDLLRLYATERLHAEEPPAEHQAATARLIDHYVSTAEAAERLLIPKGEPSEAGRFASYEDATAWYESELANLVAVGRLAERDGYHRMGWRLPAALSAFFLHTKRWDDWIGTHERGLACARRCGDRAAEARMLSSLGAAHGDRGDLTLSEDHLTRALAIRRELGEPVALGHTLNNLAQTRRRRGDPAGATDLFTEARDLFRSAGDGYGLAASLTNLGEALIELRDLPAAAGTLREAIAVHRASGSRYGEVMALDSLGHCYHHQGRPDAALEALTRALAGRHELGDRYGAAYTHWRLGDVQASLDNKAEAAGHWRAALEIFENFGAAEADQLRAELVR